MRISLTLCALLLGCVGPRVPIVKLDYAHQQQLAGVRVLELDALNQFAFREVAHVESFSCRNKLWDASSSVTDAVNQLRYRATERSANALVDVHCWKHGTSVEANCWDWVACSGIAVNVAAIDERVDVEDDPDFDLDNNDPVAPDAPEPVAPEPAGDSAPELWPGDSAPN